ncbi:MAG TPA: type II toxin-antitoxin system VapC family toxin [Caulobacteraceae bacterium]|nr:type II toxin-antitoxin system VapC family toxin [Caulobacteraceae bacterium]
MRLLLDTHIALWTVTDSPRLPRRARQLVSASDVELFVSVVSLWEVAIKHARRRGRPGDLNVSAAELTKLIDGAACALLDVSRSHVLELEALPQLHGDPFDRMLVAQARAEPLRLLTADAVLRAYGSVIEFV